MSRNHRRNAGKQIAQGMAQAVATEVSVRDEREPVYQEGDQVRFRAGTQFAGMFQPGLDPAMIVIERNLIDRRWFYACALEALGGTFVLFAYAHEEEIEHAQ